MAKKRVNPEIFRSGITKGWPHYIKLVNYACNLRILNSWSKIFSSYWINKNVRKSLFFFSNYQRQFLLQNTRAFSLVVNDVKKVIQLRRRILLHTLYVGGFREMLTHKWWISFGVFRPLSFWYKKHKRLKVRIKRRLSKSDSYLVGVERKNIFLQNAYNAKLFQNQYYLPMYNSILHVCDTLESAKGSTSLRRYQFNVTAIRPPNWTMYISLRKFSFKKSVGFITAQPRMPLVNNYYIVLLTQLNLALHWRSSSLFSDVLKNVLDQRRRVLGFLRIIHEVLNRLHLNRYQISYIAILVTGSFGKLSRSRSVRLGRLEQNTERSVTALDYPVSYASRQIWTIRGALGMRVWFFWEK